MFEEAQVDDVDLITFTALDRCDSCGAQAYTLARHTDAQSELLFCIHHRKRHFDNLIDEGWTVVDDYEGLERLAEQEGISV